MNRLFNQNALAVLLILAIAAGCSDTTNQNDSSTHDAMDEEQITTVADFSILDTWDVVGEKGMALLVEENLDENGYVAVIKKIIADENPGVVQIFTTRQAFEATHNDQHDEDYRSGFVLMYMKSLGENGEIMWMQEEGSVSHLNGRVTGL